ncbi:MAG: 30S ribosomal protein S21 [Candidatus Margulisbacteria bacterium]|nr:30S ribosomal protein S21 [Candidatus Margulisiibacteriota bacterium]
MVHSKRKGSQSIDGLLRDWKKQCKREGVIKDFRSKEFHESNTEKKKREKRAAVQRNVRQQREDEL